MRKLNGKTMEINEEEERFLANCYLSGMSINKIEEKTGLSRWWLYKSLEKTGIKKNRLKKDLFFKNEIIDEYKNGIGVKKIMEKYDVSMYTLYKFIKNCGYKRFEKIKDVTKEKEENIIKDYVGGMNREEMRKKYKYSSKKIYYVLRKNGIRTRQNGLKEEEKDNMINDYLLNELKTKEILVKYDIGDDVLYTELRKRGIPLKNKKIYKYSEEIKCITCKQTKNRKCFHKSSIKRSGFECKECKAKSLRNYRLKREYNISTEEYEKMYKGQCGLCSICDKKEELYKLAIDHDHKTGRIRGLLCRKCNAALGLFGDNTETMKRAMKYIEKHNGENNYNSIEQEKKINVQETPDLPK